MENESMRCRSGKRPKKRKFTGNIHTRKSIEADEKKRNSTSGKKIKLTNEDVNNTDFSGYSIMDLSLMFSELENYLCCKICHGEITLKEELVSGLSSKISIECKNCLELSKFRNSRMLGTKKNIPEINRRITYAFRAVGLGHAAMKLFCGVMELPKPVSQKSYDIMVKNLLRSSTEVAHKSMTDAAKQEILATGSKDISISGDGTWKIRGHTSRIGICSVIGDISGKVIDTEVLSSYCKGCDTWKKKKGTKQYEDWKKNHEKECLINHSGSSGKMEVVGMIRIFERSETRHNARYTSYIGDGDAKTFLSITEAMPYGSDVEIKKIECVGHIQKRMGTRLRKLKQSGFKCDDKKSVGGKGRLTDKCIDKLTVYYGNAIRENKNSLIDMRKAIWAIYYHTRSTDEDPLHSFCPTGQVSWCKYQNAVHEGIAHQFTHSKTLPIPVMDAIKPIFKDLSQPKLLNRCLGGKTQNNNESFNSLVWKLCRKTSYCGKNIVQIATNEATVLFNDGNIGRKKIIEAFGLLVGLRGVTCFTELDERRIASAELRYLQNTKQMRQAKRRSEKAVQEKFALEEGPVYSAGEF